MLWLLQFLLLFHLPLFATAQSDSILHVKSKHSKKQQQRASATQTFSPKKHFLSICAMFQNETFFLKEWIEFHMLMGVDHFYLLNHLSTDNYLEILNPYIRSGIVEVKNFQIRTDNIHDFAALQVQFYNDTLKVAKHTTDWIAFIDLDEFLCPVRHDSLIDLLHEYADCAGVGINWQIFGTSGIDTLQKGALITENLIWKAPSLSEINRHTKMLVRPSCVERVNIHCCHFNKGYHAVNTDRTVLEEHPFSPIVIDTLRIQHYHFGDRNRFITCKLPRQIQWSSAIDLEHLDEYIDSYNQERDETMLKFVPHLKERLNGV